VVVKGKTSYRELQARATRERIAQAARALFRERGYVATTIEAIAGSAGVAVPTVYSAFGSKKALLEEIRRLWIEQAEVRQLHGEALKEPDIRRRLELVARLHRQQMEGGHDVIKIYQEAARAEATIGKLWTAILQSRAREVSKVIQSMAAGLKPSLNVRTATDIYMALARPEIYEELVLERGWTLDDFQMWYAGCLRQQLLAHP
jgi:TetR/AcrR family transcriptional regulator, regulator of autoinduction and epiphytic fitness